MCEPIETQRKNIEAIKTLLKEDIRKKSQLLNYLESLDSQSNPTKRNPQKLNKPNNPNNPTFSIPTSELQAVACMFNSSPGFGSTCLPNQSSVCEQLCQKYPSLFPDSYQICCQGDQCKLMVERNQKKSR